MKCERTRWEGIGGENADGRMVIKSSKSQELRKEHLANRVLAPKHEFHVPENELRNFQYPTEIGWCFVRCQKINYL